jgi:hypothetical protein
MSLFMREEREREKRERDLPRRLVFFKLSYPLSCGRKSTFEKREKKYKKKILRAANARARTMMPPALNGGQRCIFLLLFLSVR